MKAAMHGYVDQERFTMFERSAENVENRLRKLIQDVESMMAEKADEVFVYLKRDYRAALGDVDAGQAGELLPREQRQVRREIMRMIDWVENTFRKVAGLPIREDIDRDDEGSEQEDGVSGDDAAKDDEGHNKAYDQIKAENDAASQEREKTPSDQLIDAEQSPQPPSSQHKRSAVKEEPKLDASYHDNTESEPQGSECEDSEAELSLDVWPESEVEGSQHHFTESDATASDTD